MKKLFLLLISILQYSPIHSLYSSLVYGKSRSSSIEQMDASKLKVYSRLQDCDKVSCFSSLPRGFSIDYTKPNKKQFQIEFNYTINDYYNKYFLTIKNHDKKEYTTKKVNLDKKNPNIVLLDKFPEDQYIICVVLYSTNYDTSNEFPPISTSDMCVDMFIGDFLVINKNETIPYTGLLMPVLLSIVFLLLVAITIADKLRRAEVSKCLSDLRKQIASKKEQEKNASKQESKLKPQQISFNTKNYYSNKYGLKEDLVEVFIYYDHVEIVLDDKTNYYLKKEMFYFIQNYLEIVSNRLADLNENYEIDYAKLGGTFYQDYCLPRQQNEKQFEDTEVYPYKFV